MDFVVVGASHRTAPVEVRERLHVREGDVPALLVALGKDGVAPERMVLATCNRVEIYAATPEVEEATAMIVQRLTEREQGPVALLDPFLYRLRGEGAIRHAFRVASSLDSMVVGEPQILGQVKAAYGVAGGEKAVGPLLSHLMERAFMVAKRVRTETALGRAPVSVASAAVDLARQIFGTLEGRSLLLLGAGEMAELALRHLLDAGGRAVTVATRTTERAEALCARCGGRAIPFEARHEALSGADVVLCSTGAPHYVIRPPEVAEAMRRRRHRPMFLIDISVPRNIDPAVHDLEHAYLYNVDDLQAVVEANRREREREAGRAEAIVEREVGEFVAWWRGRDVVPVIAALRRWAEEVRQAALGEALPSLDTLSPRERDVIAALTAGIVNKILHHPTEELKREAAGGDGRLYVEAIRRFFPAAAD